MYKKKNPFKIPVETQPHYENEGYVVLMTLGKVLKPYASASSAVKWGNTFLSGLLRGTTKLTHVKGSGHCFVHSSANKESVLIFH